MIENTGFRINNPKTVEALSVFALYKRVHVSSVGIEIDCIEVYFSGLGGIGDKPVDFPGQQDTYKVALRGTFLYYYATFLIENANSLP